MTSCNAEGGTINDRLRRPNLLESQTATVFLAISTITRLTFASSRFGRAQSIVNVEAVDAEK